MYKGKNVNLCIPTLNRYDLIWECVRSAYEGTVKPDNVFIIDNGGSLERIPEFPDVYLYRQEQNIGVAASWNAFISNVEEYRLICNDDIKFYSQTIETLLENYDENHITYAFSYKDQANSFSCFLLSDKIIKAVGLFDDSISPGYAYFEDNDYSHRLSKEGFGSKPVLCEIEHTGSATLKKYTSTETQLHHHLFRIAQRNYIDKWGGLPGKETR